MYRHQVNGGQKRSSSRRSSLCAEQVDGDLVAAMERVSLGTTEAEATIKVPSLAEYAQGAVSSGKDGEEPVDEVDVRTIRASRPIPHDFSSVKAYLQVRKAKPSTICGDRLHPPCFLSQYPSGACSWAD